MLVIVIDKNKDIFNINDINTLYALRVAKYVKNEFENLQDLKGFKINERRVRLWLSLKYKIWKWKMWSWW